MKPRPLPYASMLPTYHNGHEAQEGDRVIDRDGFRGTVTKISEDNELFVHWNIGGQTLVSADDLDKAAE